MSKKRIHNRLEKLFDDIKEDESAVQETPKPKKGTTKPLVMPRVKRPGLLRSKALDITDAATTSNIRTEVIGNTSVMSLPVQIAEESWATLQVIDDTTPRQWDEEEQALVRQVADQLGLALENARLFQEVQRRSEELEALNAIITEASRSLNPDEILETVLAQTLKTTNITGGLISMFNPETNELELSTWENLPDAFWQNLLAKGMSGTICEYVYKTQRPLFVPDLREGAPVAPEPLTNLNIYAYLGVPLETRGRVLGTLCLFNDSPLAAEEGQRIITLVQSIGLQIGSALENANLFRQAEQQAEDMAFINRIVTQASASLDLKSTLNVIVAEIAEKLSLSAATIGLLNKTRTELTVMAAYPKTEEGASTFIGTTHPVSSNPVFQKAMQNKEAVVIENPIQKPLPPSFQRIVQEQKTKILVIIPIVSKDKPIGLLGMHVSNPQKKQPTEREIQIVQLTVAQIATAVENARLFEETQRSLEETEILYAASAELNAAETYNDLISILRKYTIAASAQVVSFVLFDRPWVGDDMPEWSIPLARWSELPQGRLQKRYHLSDFSAAKALLKPDEIVYTSDIATDERFDATTRKLYLDIFGTKSAIFAPIIGAGKWIGYMNLIYRDTTNFSEEEIRRLNGIIAQVSSTLQAIRQRETLARRAQRERLIREATAKITSSVNLQDVLKNIARTLGQTLGATHTVVRIRPPIEKEVTPKGKTVLKSTKSSNS